MDKEERHLQQEHYCEIAELISTYNETDRAFMLWYLLQDYINDTVEEQKKYNEDKADVKEYALHEMLRTHKIVAEQMRDLLYYKWS